MADTAPMPEDKDKENAPPEPPVATKRARLDDLELEMQEDDGIDADELDRAMTQIEQEHSQLAAKSTAPPPTAVPTPQLMPMEEMTDAIGDSDHAMLLSLYYRRLFPFKHFCRWLSYGNAQPNYFAHREFSFTLREPVSKSEIYLRFCSFANKKELKEEIIKKNPEKIDIGAVYSAKPKLKSSLRPGAFKPVERELVFDIDMTDYDEVRTCCKGADICHKCWKFMTIAMKLMHYALTDSFGFKHIMWVYSGRRGIHCWVADDRARKLSEESRKAVVSFIEVVRGGDQKAKKVFLGAHLHPYIRHCAELIREMFEEVVLGDQDVLSNREMEDKMLELVPSAVLREKIGECWSRLSTSQEKWDLFTQTLEANKTVATANLVLEIQFQYLYPRLDAQVSMHLNHLLKSPLCVHPKTGRVCVPIAIEQCDEFDPLAAPTVADLCREINAFDKQNPDKQLDSNGKRLADWKKTQLKQSVAILDRFVGGLEEDVRQQMIRKREASQRSMEF